MSEPADSKGHTGGIARKQGGYDFHLARRLRQCSAISHASYRVAEEILNHENRSGVAWPSVRKLAAALGMRRSAAHRCLAALRRIGLLTAEPLQDLWRRGLVRELDRVPSQQAFGYLVNHEWRADRSPQGGGVGDVRPLHEDGHAADCSPGVDGGCPPGEVEPSTSGGKSVHSRWTNKSRRKPGQEKGGRYPRGREFATVKP